MKKIIINISILILLIGIVSAGLIGYYGKITGTIEINNPIFYLDLNETGDNHQLLINEIKNNKQKDWTNEISFETRDLDIDTFYQTTFKTYLWIKADNSINSVKIEIRKKDNTLICNSTEQTVKSTGHFKREFECNSLGEITLGSGEGFKLIIKETTGIPNLMSIQSGHKYSSGYDRIEVSKIWN